MKYKIKTTKQFEKDFRKSEKSLRENVIKKIDKLRENPYSFKRLHGSLKGKHSLRVGDYRVVYVINDNKKEVILYCLGHRKRVYERI
ncbi:MAG: type II toxin-antitoxin system RelE/ParE family toxin [Candidatus Thermoplasmatota archaeon]|nr:type II toxin-antitoxin system RelE/ParE family toxin [Candidatus Thermoplasmatota archaeon]